MIFYKPFFNYLVCVNHLFSARTLTDIPYLFILIFSLF